MPAPLTGMEPFLEGPLWTSFHALLVTEIIRLLNPRLRPRYVALTQQYQQISIGQEFGSSVQSMYPNVGILRNEPAVMSSSTAAAGVAPVQMTLLLPVQAPHPYIEIRRLVTVIEFLSPANEHSPGRRKCQRKRQRLLHSSVHLLEVDLLHHGRRIPVQGNLPKCPYFVFLSRVERRPAVDIWPIPFGEPLPVVKVPLAAGDADVSLDLQEALTAAYDLGGFEDLINYGAAPPTAEERAILHQHLQSSGKRPAV